MEGMIDIRNEIEQRLGVFARQGAKAEMGKYELLEHLRQAHRAQEAGNKRALIAALDLAKREINSTTPGHLRADYSALREEAEIMPSDGAKATTGKYELHEHLRQAHRAQEAGNKRALIAALDLAKREINSTTPGHLRADYLALREEAEIMSRPGAKATMATLTSSYKANNLHKECVKWCEAQNERINNYAAHLQRTHRNDPVLTDVNRYFKGMSNFVNAACAKIPSSSGPQDVDNWLSNLRKFYDTLKTRGQTVLDDGFARVHHLVAAADRKKGYSRPGAKAEMAISATDPRRDLARQVTANPKKYALLMIAHSTEWDQIYKKLNSLADEALNDNDKRTYNVASNAIHNVIKAELAIHRARNSRPGAKATMGILDRISRGLSAATAKPVDPTTPQYLSGLTAAKKAAEEAKSNYEYMADLNDARFKQLDNYVKVTSNMITKMNSSADIQRLIAGLKAAVAARVFVQSSMKTPFSRSQAKIVFASQIGNGNNAFATQIQNAIDKITKLHFEIANFATDLEASWYYHRNKDKGKQYKALVEEAGNLLNQVDDFASTVIMLGRGRNQSTESMRADAAKAEAALRKLPAFKERLGMIRRAAAKVDAFSRLGDKTEFADGCGSGAGGFKPGNTCGKEDGKASGGGAKKKKKPTSPKPATPRLTRREERRQEVENRVKARQAEERARKRTKRTSGPVDLGEFEEMEELKFNLSERKVENCNVDSRPLSYGKGCETEQDKAGLKLMEKADKAVSDKIRTLIKEGKPQDQAVAIALDMKRRGEL